MNELTISLNPASSIPMYEQIYHYIKNDIASGTISRGQKLPSTRALADYLEVSRSTTQMAYDQLLSEGYIESVACKGYFACQLDGLYQLEQLRQSPVTISASMPSTSAASQKKSYQYDFSPRGIALDCFPFNAWRKVTRNVLVDDNKDLFNIGEPEGEPEFCRTICDYLHQSRGVSCTPEQIIIGAGNEYLLMLMHQLLPAHLSIAMENPTYRQAYDTFRGMGREVLPVSMDKSGMRIDMLNASGADIAYVMPSHQFPLGIVMPVKRRSELLQWAAEGENRYIIEDDYDSEFRYKGKPIPSLQSGAGSADKVIYLGTFSKAIAPAIRMSYVVLPHTLLKTYKKHYRFLACTVSRIDQTIVTQFIKEGYYERHLNKMRALYKNRHDILLNELKKFESTFDISGEYAGIHVLLRSKRKISEAAFIHSAAQSGIHVYPLSPYFIQSAADTQNNPATIIIGYANIGTDDIIAGLQQLYDAWKLSGS